MRLLDTTTLRLVHRREGDVPPYAILSHTWGGDDDEVSFTDIQELSSSNDAVDHLVTKKPGFAKIRDSARLAKSEGYSYIWIDTCCIDKTSSAELSEAINSMFRWYGEAAVCYAILNDVDDDHLQAVLKDDEQEDGQIPDDSGVIKSIEQSRWFTRGWTLQELIAPANVYFYSQSWNLLGSKLDDAPKRLPSVESFAGLVSTITGVDMGVLTGFVALDDLSVASRMKWAANRQTTRTEDIAYCLMGIFNVHMPLLYGEGTRAFLRLQEEILKVTHDHSIFCWECGKKDMLRYQLSGLLALSPTYFQNFGDITPAPVEFNFSQSRTSAPSTMTNAGLHVQLSLQDLARPQPRAQAAYNMADAEEEQEPEWYAILDCLPRSVSNGVSAYPAIRLVELGGDQYSRLQTEEVFWLDESQVRDIERKYIYVKQLPTYGLPDIHVPEIYESSDSNWASAVWNLIDVYPQTGWSPQTRTLKPDTSKHNRVLGIFRYGIQHNAAEGNSELTRSVIEVSVGILPGQQGSLSWSCWCYIQAASSDLDGWLPLPGSTGSGSNPDKEDETGESGRSLLGSKAGEKQDSNVRRFTDTCIFRSICATVKPIRLRNKTYLSLILSQPEIFELGVPGPPSAAPSPKLTPVEAEDPLVANPVEQDSTEQMADYPSNAFELDASTEYAEAQLERASDKLVDLAATLTAHDEWQSTLGVKYAQSYRLLSPSIIRISRPSATDRFEAEWDYSWQAFGEILERATSFNLRIKRPEGAEPKIIEDYFSLLLVKACIRDGSTSTAAELLASPLSTADVEVRTEMNPNIRYMSWHIVFEGFRPIHWATIFGHTNTVQQLLAYGADASTFTDSGLTAVHLAAIFGHADILDLLLNATVSDDDLLPKWYEGFQSDAIDSPLHLAAAYAKSFRHQNMLGRLVFASPDSMYDILNARNKFGETPLHRAAAMNNYMAAKFLIESVDPIHRPSHGMDNIGRTPLWHAAAAGATVIVEAFLKYKPDLEVTDDFGRTPLHAACRGGHLQAVEVLLIAGADPNATTTDFLFTPCHFATIAGNAVMLRALLRHGAKMNFNSQRSAVVLEPIHIAAANGFAECARVLVEAGCDFSKSATHRLIVKPDVVHGVSVTTTEYGSPEELANLVDVELASYFHGLWARGKESAKSPERPQTPRQDVASESDTLRQDSEFEGQSSRWKKVWKGKVPWKKSQI
ncbi:hypothetical protein QBC38DRAFT_489799 [Podospora fimiseda]|uniref:Heterokaryon incompatibility domain-containing protein n=1 Tax=Podospora fimiseda TaxID=252190 RepID=A0AAN6YNE2_9PEZI|nr:hypothetical protein QBC38DRAFT_489799 [Podospora fimiseda]